MAGRPVALAGVHVGDELPPCGRVVTREDVLAYADASGDRNPLHRDEATARAAGFPGVIAHGMFTMGHLAACVARWAGDPAAVVRLSAQFRSPVYLGEEIVAGGVVRHVDPQAGTAALELWVTVERDGAIEHAVKRGAAEIRFPA